MPWYTTPAALAQFEAIGARPAIVRETCALSGASLFDYAIPAELEALHHAAIKAHYAAPVWDEAAAGDTITASPSMILHARFGSAGWYEESDFGGLWAGIRANLADATRKAA